MTSSRLRGGEPGSAWLVAITRGQSGNPYGWLLAVGGLAYLLVVAWFRWRG